jgi:hypothetical protein
MQKSAELYLISEPEAPIAAVVPNEASTAAPPQPREHSWRDLMRRLQKSPAAHKPT